MSLVWRALLLWVGSVITRLFQRRADKKAGELEHVAREQAEALARASEAARAEDAVRRMPDDILDRELRRFSRQPPTKPPE